MNGLYMITLQVFLIAKRSFFYPWLIRRPGRSGLRAPLLLAHFVACILPGRSSLGAMPLQRTAYVFSPHVKPAETSTATLQTAVNCAALAMHMVRKKLAHQPPAIELHACLARAEPGPARPA